MQKVLRGVAALDMFAVLASGFRVALAKGGRHDALSLTGDVSLVKSLHLLERGAGFPQHEM